jgi:hypothetical protein
MKAYWGRDAQLQALLISILDRGECSGTQSPGFTLSPPVLIPEPKPVCAGVSELLAIN